MYPKYMLREQEIYFRNFHTSALTTIALKHKSAKYYKLSLPHKIHFTPKIFMKLLKFTGVQRTTFKCNLIIP